MTERDFIHRGFGGSAVVGDIAPAVVLTVSREDARAVAAGWSDTRMVADHYGFLVLTGRHGEVRLTACSAGLGSAAAAVAIEELARLGASTILGVGSMWAGVWSVADGSIVIADGALRGDAASHGYARLGVPAAAHPDVVMAATAAARRAGHVARHAVVADLEVDPGAAAQSSRSKALDATIRETGALPVHGSPAVLFVAGAVHGLRTGFLAGSADTGANDAGTLDIAIATLLTMTAWDAGPDGLSMPVAERMRSMPRTDRRIHR